MSQQSFSFGPWNNSLGRFNKTYLAIFPNPRSGWKHKAWGAAKRNPRWMTRMKIERAKRAIAQTPQLAEDESAVAHFVGSSLAGKGYWGSASLHPRLYAIATLRGLRTNTIFHWFKSPILPARSRPSFRSQSSSASRSPSVQVRAPVPCRPLSRCGRWPARAQTAARCNRAGAGNA